MKTNLFLLFLLSLAGYPRGYSAPLLLDTMLVQLGTYQANSKQYVDRKEKQIAEWRLKQEEAAF